jgi:hypothetical protein
MQSRKPQENIAFMKNLLGTIKVMGVPTKLKVNKGLLLGTSEPAKERAYSKHDEFKIL